VTLLDEVPGVVGHFHLDQHVAGKEAALGDRLLAVLQLDDFFHRHQDAAELVLQLGAVDALAQVSLDGFFHAGIGVDDVPALVRRRGDGLGSHFGFGGHN
jgi:hypothetical protein